MMKDNRLIYLSLLFGGIIALSAYFGVAGAVSRPITSNLPSGIHGEEIDGMVHQVEYHYGSSLIYDINSMLKDKSVETFAEDRISYFPNPILGVGSQIVIKRANQVVVNDAGKEITYRTWATNVGDFLTEKNIEVGENDLINLSNDQDFSKLLASSDRGVVARDGRDTLDPVLATIEITRVAITEVKEKQDINYKTITKEDPNLERGTTDVKQEGKKGIKELAYEVRRENGKEVSRKLLKTEVTKEPVDKVIIKGTKVVIFGAGNATWYGLIGGMTAAHNTLPKGTMVHVVNIENGKSVDVKIVDRGIQGSAIIDLSDDAFRQLAPLGKGVIKVRLEKM